MRRGQQRRRLGHVVGRWWPPETGPPASKSWNTGGGRPLAWHPLPLVADEIIFIGSTVSYRPMRRLKSTPRQNRSQTSFSVTCVMPPPIQPPAYSPGCSPAPGKRRPGLPPQASACPAWQPSHRNIPPAGPGAPGARPGRFPGRTPAPLPFAAAAAGPGSTSPDPGPAGGPGEIAAPEGDFTEAKQRVLPGIWS